MQGLTRWTDPIKQKHLFQLQVQGFSYITKAQNQRLSMLLVVKKGKPNQNHFIRYFK